MSDQQENPDTESVSSSASCEQAEPTPGPWEVNHDGPCPSVHAKDSSDSIAAVLLSADPSSDRDVEADARLIAAAGTAAQEAKEMGYDPVAAVEVLPELLKALEDGVDAAKHAEALESRHEPVMNGNGGGARPETKDRLQALKNVLASAEGSG